MKQEFWHDKWEADQIGFHLESTHPLLQKFHKKTFASSEKIFVPLCGKTKDLIFLSQQHQVIGNELSDKAVRAFYLENYSLEDDQVAKLAQSHALDKITTKSLAPVKYLHDSVSILQGDFFQLRAEQLENANAIYDRAALIALPEAMREDYVQQLKKLFKSANMLLITLEYEQDKMSGPPFSVSQEEVTKLFDYAQIELLYSKDIIQKEPRFQSKGLQSFVEAAYQITW